MCNSESDSDKQFLYSESNHLLSSKQLFNYEQEKTVTPLLSGHEINYFLSVKLNDFKSRSYFNIAVFSSAVKYAYFQFVSCFHTIRINADKSTNNFKIVTQHSLHKRRVSIVILNCV